MPYVVTSLTVIVAAGSALAAPVQIDFGDLNQQTPGNVNNITHLQNPLFNLVDTTGAGSGIGIDILDAFWPGSNTSGTSTPGGDAAGIPTTATVDNLFGSEVAFGGFTEPTGGFVLTGLDASGMTAYDFMFFGSRMNVGDNRWTYYDVTGANNGRGTLNTSNNTDNVAWVTGITADANGEVYVEVGADAMNDNSFKFYYLGFMEMTSYAVPAPAGLAVVGLGLAAGRRRR
ncbi:MAG: hypothetical protein H6810_03050 [Phycisphaeraceae bacterium]|nr:MAG: hypothetical protein H6810_03050 [Phycisphaeraceae bacterium]